MPKRRTHPAAPRTFPPLTSEQEQAMTLLLNGKTTTEVATVLQCSADEVQHWRHEHPVFVARLNQAKRQRWDEAQDLLRALVPEAIATLEKAMQQGERQNGGRTPQDRAASWTGPPTEPLTPPGSLQEP
jgi:hypothetical protein